MVTKFAEGAAGGAEGDSLLAERGKGDRKNWQVASSEREGAGGVGAAGDTIGAAWTTAHCGWRLLHSLYNYFKHSIGIRPQEATAGYVFAQARPGQARPQLYPFKCNNRHQDPNGHEHVQSQSEMRERERETERQSNYFKCARCN